MTKVNLVKNNNIDKYANNLNKQSTLTSIRKHVQLRINSTSTLDTNQRTSISG